MAGNIPRDLISDHSTNHSTSVVSLMRGFRWRMVLVPRLLYSPHIALPCRAGLTNPSPRGFPLLSVVHAWRAALRAEAAYEDERARGRPRTDAARAAFIALTNGDFTVVPRKPSLSPRR
jgi:hypothetical protein